MFKQECKICKENENKREKIKNIKIVVEYEDRREVYFTTHCPNCMREVIKVKR